MYSEKDVVLTEFVEELIEVVHSMVKEQGKEEVLKKLNITL